MSIAHPSDLAGMRRAGRLVAETIAAMRAAVRPGVTTAALDAIAGGVLDRAGGRSAPKLVYRFPGVTCISVNDEAVHGVPGRRVLREGDLVTLDVTAELDGYMADAAVTVPVGRVSRDAANLVAAAEGAFNTAIAAAVPGTSLRDLGARSKPTSNARASRCSASCAATASAGRFMNRRTSSTSTTRAQPGG